MYLYPSSVNNRHRVGSKIDNKCSTILNCVSENYRNGWIASNIYKFIYSNGKRVLVPKTSMTTSQENTLEHLKWTILQSI